MQILEKILKTQDLATLPVVASKILHLLENENINIQMIARLVESDPALSIKVLRIANSPIFASRVEVTSLSQAIMNLGINRLSNIILSVSIFSKFMMNKNQNLAKYVDKFWWHSSSVGVVSKIFAQKTQQNFKEKEFLAGLLHDIGKLILMQYDPISYEQVLKRQEEEPNLSDIDVEKEIFGINHFDVGLAIAQKWKLPSEMIEVIRYHNFPSKSLKQQKLVATVRMADLLCEIWGAGFYEGIHTLDMEEEESWKVLKTLDKNLATADLAKITFEVENEFLKSSEFLAILKSN